MAASAHVDGSRFGPKLAADSHFGQQNVFSANETGTPM